MKAWVEARVGSLIAAAGVGWAVYHGTYETHDLRQAFTAIELKQGPLEVCAIGILLWLHAKWRIWTNMNR